MAFMSFFGYIFFVIFGGVGLSALPIDMITDYTSRPKIV
jgi:LMBR1 domain-containing protein 1